MRRLSALLTAAAVFAPAIAPAQTVWERIHSGASEASASLLEEGLAYELRGQLDDALLRYERAELATPDDPTPVYYALQALREQPDEVLARTSSRLAHAQAGPHRSRLLFYRAIAHLDRGELAEAADALEEATRFRGDLPEIERFFANLGEIHAVLGNSDRAIAFYRAAVAVNPDHALARLGLAVALERLGLSDEARPHMQAVVQRHEQLGFLREPGVFFLRDGEEELYAALFYEALSEFEAAAEALARHAASAAGAATPSSVLAALQERMAQPWIEREIFDVPDCQPLAVDVTVDGDRMAVICEGSGILEGPVTRGVWSGVGHANGAWNAYNLLDVAYVDDTRIHVLRYDNVLDAYALGGTELELLTTVAFNNTALTPQQLIDRGQRVVFSGASVAGVQWADWDAAAVATNLHHPALPFGWLAYVSSSRDEQRYCWSDGPQTYVMNTAGQTLSTLRVGPSTMYSVGPVLSPDGGLVAAVSGSRLTIYDAQSGTLNATVQLGTRAPVSALTWSSDSRLAVGQFGRVSWYDATAW